MTIASARSRPTGGSFLRRRLFQSLLLGAGALAGCRTSQPVTPVAAAPAKPTVNESKYAWGSLERADAKVADDGPAKASPSITLTSSASAYPAPGSFGAFRSEAPLLRPASMQSADSTPPKSLTTAPQSSTAGATPLNPVPSGPAPLNPGMFSGGLPAPVPLSTVLGTPILDQATAPTILSDDCNACVAGRERTFGVSADQCGLLDNVSARLAWTLSVVDPLGSMNGAVGIVEGTKQLDGSNLFIHGGYATEVLDDHWMMSFTAGFSRLARIHGEEVCDPWIAAVTYDGYWDPKIFGWPDTIYTDQLRILGGFALRPRWDVGAWGAIGLSKDRGLVTVPSPVVGATPAVFATTRYFANRVAGYSSFDLNDHGAQVIASVGWEDTHGRVFAETDGFFPIGKNVNFFAGGGFSNGGNWDVVAGLEFLHGASTKQRRRGGFASCEDPCACTCSCNADCGDRYRGGWANGVYRSALRVLTPSRDRRYLMNEFALVQPPLLFLPPETPAPVVPPATVPPATVPPATPIPVPVPPPVVTPTPNPPPPNRPPPPPNNPGPTAEPCPPRLDGHTHVEGRLSQWLKDNASANAH